MAAHRARLRREKKEGPDVLARDVDDNALRLARENARRAGVRIRTIRGPVEEVDQALDGRVVVVNPPYGERLEIDPESIRWVAWAVTVFAGLTMVSNLKYYSFKTINLRRSVPFLAIFSIVLFFVLVSYQPAIVLFAGFVIYALAGYVWSAWLALKRRRS